MPQYIVSPEDVTENKFVIKNPQEIRHLIEVLRIQPGEKIYLFDGTKKRYLAKITEIKRDRISGKILQELPYQERPFFINIFPSLIKSDRFELLLEKVTELGVDKITPIVTDRTIIKIPKSKIESKIERWGKIIISAVKQSMCQKIPELNQIKIFSDAVSQISTNDLNLIAFESESQNSNLKKLLTPQPSVSIDRINHSKFYTFSTNFLNRRWEVNLFIGPEGGFSEKEIKLAKSFNLKTFSLGTNILRTETATIVAIGVIQNLLST